jgi:hypothetical protein
MSENISMTRIMDLPEGNSSMGSMGPMGSANNSQGLTGLSNTYLPMDVHPNPYGMPPPPAGGMIPPQQTHMADKMRENPVYSPDQFANMQQKLPQRDIPMDISQHIQDEQIQPNYIPPPPKITRDYIQEYQTTSDRDIREHEERKMREKKRSEWLDELQVPILVGLLYFVFQLPIVNTMIFKQFSFLSIYREDGNFNLMGLTLKCMLFAFVYYSMNKAIDVIGGM